MWKTFLKHAHIWLISCTGHTWQIVQKSIVLLLSREARVLRFICTGGISGLMQLALLSLLAHLGMKAILANALAFLLAAELNFVLSYSFTWWDRQPEKHARRTLLQCWAAFHGSIFFTALLNQVVFVVTYTMLPYIVSSALGICTAAAANFAMSGRFIFRERLSSSNSASSR